MNENNMNMWSGKSGIGRSIMLVATMLFIFLLVQTIAGLKNISIIGEGIAPQNTIVVSGTGYAFAVPDVATVDFDVTHEAAAVPDAQAAVTTQMNAILAYLKGQGIADADVKTINYSIEPHYTYTSAQPAICQANGICPPANATISGYDVTDSVEVTIHDTNKAGAILAGLGSQKVSNLSGLNFTVENPDSVQSQARANAIADAKTKAQTLASQLGVRLMRIVSFSENGSVPIRYALSTGSAAPSSAPVPNIPAGQNKITSDVTITYEID